MTTTPTWYEALEFAARHQSSDWPEHCQQIVKMARAALAQKDHDDDLITIPRGLVAAACAAIRIKRDSPKLIAELRRYTTGDLSRTEPQQAEVVPDFESHLREIAKRAITQQAEAVPSDGVRDAAPIPGHELVTMYDERPTSDLEMIEFAREVERRHGIGVQPQHITDGSPCWCNPDVAYTDPETGASVIVHRRPQ